MSSQIKSDEKAKAKTVLGASTNSAAVISEYSSPFGELNIEALADSLSDTVEQVAQGNMRKCEAMLITQAHALQSIFMNLSRRAIKQEYIRQYETFLKLALKAQSQCRATLETLAMIKNPPVVFAKQANISNGNQQVNNLTHPHPSRAEKNKFDSNELLENKDEQRLEHTTTPTPSGDNKKLETLETLHRPQDKNRQNKSLSERLQGRKKLKNT